MRAHGAVLLGSAGMLLVDSGGIVWHKLFRSPLKTICSSSVTACVPAEFTRGAVAAVRRRQAAHQPAGLQLKVPGQQVRGVVHEYL